jgi:uncharacterized protein (TIGR02588 family)
VTQAARRGSQRREPNDGERPAQHAASSIWEWVAAGIGGAMVVAVVAFMAYEAATLSPHPTARLAIRIDTVVAYPSGYIVELRAINSGDATAASVLVQGELRGDTGVVERSEVTVDFVPARSWRAAGLVFKNDPRRHRMEVRPVGFDRP